MEIEFKGTKGKWEIDGTTVKNDIKLVCNCVSNGINFTKEDKANAKLIASAPEMLEMLKIARDKFLDLKHDKNFPELQEIQYEIEKIIKKATE